MPRLARIKLGKTSLPHPVPAWHQPLLLPWGSWRSSLRAHDAVLRGIDLPRPPGEEQLPGTCSWSTWAVPTVPLVHDPWPFWIPAGFLQRCCVSRVEISNGEVGLEGRDPSARRSLWMGRHRPRMPAPVYGPAPGLLFLVLAKQVCPKFPKQMLLWGEGQLNLLFTGL